MKKYWIITDDKAGTRAQGIALAHAMGLDAEIKTLVLKRFLAKLPICFLRCLKNPYRNEVIFSEQPDIVIAAGRGAVPAALRLKHSGSQVVFIQDPYINPAHFDCVIAPEHDRLAGQNVIPCIGALSKINATILTEAMKTWQDKLSHFPHPRVAVLIGGNSSLYKLDEKTVRNIAKQLQDVQKKYRGSLFVTVSRRTGENEKNVLQAELQGENIFFHDGVSENPYVGFLAYADAILVTEDSVSMHCEAAATGKPIYTVRLPKKWTARFLGKGKKFQHFQGNLQKLGIARFFEGKIENWDYAPFNEAARVAELVKQKLETI